MRALAVVILPRGQHGGRAARLVLAVGRVEEVSGAAAAVDGPRAEPTGGAALEVCGGGRGGPV